MRRRDPQMAEDGFQRPVPIAGQHVEKLIGAFAVETDHGVRCWLLELIGEARSSHASYLLTAMLRSDDELSRHGAERGLRLLNTKEARRMLWQHGRNTSPVDGLEP